MQVRVRFFASLREQVGVADREAELPAPATVRQAWAAATGDAPLPAHVLCAVNYEYVSPQEEVAEGDEVAFFPPVTGG